MGADNFEERGKRTPAMTPSSLESRKARAAEEAAEWLQRFESGHISASDRGDFVDWLRESPLHVAETLRIERLASALAQFPDWAKIAPTQQSPNKVVSLPLQAGGQRPRTRIPLRSKVAAAVAGIAVVGGSLLLVQRNLTPMEIRTHAGERRELTLEDGSVVTLAPSTYVRVTMKSKLRSVSLERGEAVFRVAKDAARPFVVSAARASVQAVGTVFAVARNGDNVVVTVTEGRVSVVPSLEDARGNVPERTSIPIALQANERVSISPAGTASEVRRVAATLVPTWNDNQLVFENARVSDVVSQFNQRNRMQIHVNDEALSARTVSGIFDADDPQSFVDFLTVVAGAVSTASGSDDIVVAPHMTGADSNVPRR